MALTRIVAAVVDGTKLTLYKDDGTTVEILQGDARLKPIIDKITPVISAGGIAEVDLHYVEELKDNTYRDFEKKSGGITRLFRIAKKFVQDLIKPDDSAEFHTTITVPAQIIGEVPGTKEPENDPQPTPVPAPAAPEKITSAIDNIIANATPVSHESFDDRDTLDDDTIVAVVDDKVIPGVENLKGQFANANKLGSETGVQNFLRRMAAIIDKRGHSMQELLNFMSRGDLPIADDGSIIAYKVLSSASKTSKPTMKGLFYDCYSGNVPQRVGSFVCMDLALIDTSRRTECSTGLHIARRGYLGGFSGDVITMVKIAPEDVIAVPDGEPHKMRVAGYHILAKIPKVEHGHLRNNKAIKGSEAQRILGMAIRGDHVMKTEEVRIHGAYGNDVKITSLVPDEVKNVTIPKVTPEALKVEAIPLVSAKPNGRELSAPKVDPKAVAAKTTKLKEGATRNQLARQLYTDAKFEELKALKKKAKVGWDKLGFSPDETVNILSLEEPAVTEAAKPVEEAKTKETKKMDTTNRAEVARKLFDEAVAGERSRWGTLWQHKKKAKQSWKKLGFTAKEIDRINTNKPDWV